MLPSSSHPFSAPQAKSSYWFVHRHDVLFSRNRSKPLRLPIFCPVQLSTHIWHSATRVGLSATCQRSRKNIPRKVQRLQRSPGVAKLVCCFLLKQRGERQIDPLLESVLNFVFL